MVGLYESAWWLSYAVAYLQDVSPKYSDCDIAVLGYNVIQNSACCQ